MPQTIAVGIPRRVTGFKIRAAKASPSLFIACMIGRSADQTTFPQYLVTWQTWKERRDAHLQLRPLSMDAGAQMIGTCRASARWPSVTTAAGTGHPTPRPPSQPPFEPRAFNRDGWGRSLVNYLSSLEELDRLGVRFVVPGQGIDTDKNSPVGRLLMHVLGAVGQFERQLIKERVIAGVRQAQAKGTKSGRPFGRPKRVFRRDLAIQMRAEGKSWAAIGRVLGVPLGTVREGLRKPPAGNPPESKATSGSQGACAPLAAN